MLAGWRVPADDAFDPLGCDQIELVKNYDPKLIGKTLLQAADLIGMTPGAAAVRIMHDSRGLAGITLTLSAMVAQDAGMAPHITGQLWCCAGLRCFKISRRCSGDVMMGASDCGRTLMPVRFRPRNHASVLRFLGPMAEASSLHRARRHADRTNGSSDFSRYLGSFRRHTRSVQTGSANSEQSRG